MNKQFQRCADKAMHALYRCAHLRKIGKNRRADFWARISNRWFDKSLTHMSVNEQLALAA